MLESARKIKDIHNILLPVVGRSKDIPFIVRWSSRW